MTNGRRNAQGARRHRISHVALEVGIEETHLRSLVPRSGRSATLPITGDQFVALQNSTGSTAVISGSWSRIPSVALTELVVCFSISSTGAMCGGNRIRQRQLTPRAARCQTRGRSELAWGMVGLTPVSLRAAKGFNTRRLIRRLSVCETHGFRRRSPTAYLPEESHEAHANQWTAGVAAARCGGAVRRFLA